MFNKLLPTVCLQSKKDYNHTMTSSIRVIHQSNVDTEKTLKIQCSASTRLCDYRHDFRFAIIKFPHLDSSVPTALVYEVFIYHISYVTLELVDCI